MSYLVLARKWRPQSFEDLVGQEHVSTTIGNAIAQNRVAHAFLFTGVRGVGKTTSARILAKALNCAKGPTAKPCQVCPQCVEITAGNDIDVQEIDGASYNGVDEVRKLQETLPYRPQRDRFKLFIVDEVHMLSNAAWNAFLKTLEEPPPHVKFIFATTEVHKVPVTILSRCQRYDFKLIGAKAIAARLRWVLEQENVLADDAAVSAIAREAAGSMRDAMSLLDQVIAWVGVEGDRLTGEGVAKVLGVADRVVLHRLGEAMITGDAGSCVRIVGELAQQGFDLPHVARDFLAHLRDLVIAKVAEDASGLLDMSDEEAADVKALAARSDTDDLTRLHQGFSRAFDDVVRGGQPRAALEMTLVRLARRPPLLPIDELIRRLGDLERRLGGPPAGPSGAPGRGAPPAAGSSGGPQASSRRPAGASSAAEASASEVAQTPSRADADAPATLTNAPMATAQATPFEGAPTVPARPPIHAAASVTHPPARPTGATPPAVPGATFSVPARSAASGSFPAFPMPVQSPAPSPARPISSPAPSPVVPPNPSPVSVDVGAWREVLVAVRAKRPALASVLEHAALLRFGASRVELGYESNSFLLGQANEPVAKDILAGALAAHFGGPVDLSIETIATKTHTVSVASLDTADRKLKLDAARRAVANHPLVTAVIEVFGAELQDVRLPRSLN